jgi:hypothetical protein
MFRSYSAIWGESDFSAFERERPRIVNNFAASALPGPFFPLCHEQAESFLRCVLKRFSARNYCIAPRLWQPDFGWDHAGVPLAFSMALTTCSGLFDGIKR